GESSSPSVRVTSSVSNAWRRLCRSSREKSRNSRDHAGAVGAEGTGSRGCLRLETRVLPRSDSSSRFIAMLRPATTKSGSRTAHAFAATAAQGLGAAHTALLPGRRRVHLLRAKRRNQLRARTWQRAHALGIVVLSRSMGQSARHTGPRSGAFVIAAKH